MTINITLNLSKVNLILRNCWIEYLHATIKCWVTITYFWVYTVNFLIIKSLSTTIIDCQFLFIHLSGRIIWKLLQFNQNSLFDWSLSFINVCNYVCVVWGYINWCNFNPQDSPAKCSQNGLISLHFFSSSNFHLIPML